MEQVLLDANQNLFLLTERQLAFINIFRTLKVGSEAILRKESLQTINAGKEVEKRRE